MYVYMYIYMNVCNLYCLYKEADTVDNFMQYNTQSLHTNCMT